jgi:putative ABC transport system permease protein
VYARLGITGVGPFDRSYFVSFKTAATMIGLDDGGGADPAKASALLVRIDVGVRRDQAHFALANRPNWKIADGNLLFTSVRHSMTTVLSCAAGVVVLMLFGTGLMVASEYSAVVSERRKELGILLAVGMRARQLVRLLVAEAMLTTALGGIGGVLLGGTLLLVLRRSLVYHLEWVDVPFRWPTTGWMIVDVVVCLCVASVLGLAGSALPAWHISHREPHDLVRTEGA